MGTLHRLTPRYTTESGIFAPAPMPRCAIFRFTHFAIFTGATPLMRSRPPCWADFSSPAIFTFFAGISSMGISPDFLRTAQYRAYFLREGPTGADGHADARGQHELPSGAIRDTMHRHRPTAGAARPISPAAWLAILLRRQGARRMRDDKTPTSSPTKICARSCPSSHAGCQDFGRFSPLRARHYHLAAAASPSLCEHAADGHEFSSRNAAAPRLKTIWL